jgi:hypothetical protein
LAEWSKEQMARLMKRKIDQVHKVAGCHGGEDQLDPPEQQAGKDQYPAGKIEGIGFDLHFEEKILQGESLRCELIFRLTH